MTEKSRLQSFLKSLFKPLSLALALLGFTLYFSAQYRAQGHWESAEILKEKGELKRAALHYQWAARAYYPASLVGDQALKCLWDLAQQALRSGKKQEALYYLSLLRGAIRSSTWLLSPYEQWAEPVDQILLELYKDHLNELNQQELIKVNLKADLRVSTGQSINIILSLIALFLSLKYLMTLGLGSRLESTEHTRKGVFLSLCSLVMFYWALAL